MPAKIKKIKNAPKKTITLSLRQVIVVAVIFAGISTYATWVSFAAPASAVNITQISPGTFRVEAVSKKMVKNKYSLWVANKCTNASGAIVSAQHEPVSWPSSSSNIGSVSDLNPPPDNASKCYVYVWLFPSSESPVGSVYYYR